MTENIDRQSETDGILKRKSHVEFQPSAEVKISTCNDRNEKKVSLGDKCLRSGAREGK